MTLYLKLIKIITKKLILKKNIGLDIKKICLEKGIVYIKFGQILASQNIGNIFTEEDRKALSSICDDCKPVKYKEILKILKEEYGEELFKIFSKIEKEPLGSASVSIVHKATLKNGEEVAIKIKRKNITNKIKKDIKDIKKITQRLGKIFKHLNTKGINKALDLYLEWIDKETDFKNEKNNLKIYSKYTDSVNGKIKGTSKLFVPKLYEQLSRKNVIVMEYIKYPTINQIELNKENKELIKKALNSYIKLNFWAMFNDKPIAFHGDPHCANLAIDTKGNLYFLDLGLLFTLDQKSSNICRDFFLSIYSKNDERLYNMLITYGNLTEKEKIKLKKEIKKYIEEVQEKNVTHYFIDLITVAIKYEIVPPDFLFNMAKSFACIYGICTFTNNNLTASQTLKYQVTDYIIKKNLKTFNKSLWEGIEIFKKKEYFKEAFSDYIADNQIKDIIIKLLENIEEIIDLAT